MTCLLSLLLLFARATPARACAVCGAADRALPANGNEIPFAGRKRGIVEARAAAFETSARDLGVREVRAEAAASVAIGESTLVGVSAPIVWRASATRASGGSLGAAPRTNDGTRAMPGDVELRAAHTAYRSSPRTVARRLTLGFTVKLPTAPIDRDALGIALHPDLQPGCGSIVPWASGTYAFSAPLWSAWTTLGLLLPASVRDGPHPGASLRASTTLQLQPTRHLATRVGAHARWDGAGDVDGEVLRASGGAAVHVAPELVVSPTTDLVFTLGASFPAVQAMRGYRTVAPIAIASVALDF